MNVGGPHIIIIVCNARLNHSLTPLQPKVDTKTNHVFNSKTNHYIIITLWVINYGEHIIVCNLDFCDQINSKGGKKKISFAKVSYNFLSNFFLVFFFLGN